MSAAVQSTYLPYSVSADALHSVLGYLAQEWGEERGDRVVAIRSLDCGRIAVATIRARDGAEWEIAADRYGVPCDPTTGRQYRYDATRHAYVDDAR